MLARWYLLLGQFSVTFEYQPGSQHSNAGGMSRQCGQCRQPDCPVSAADLPAADADTQSLLVDQPFASSEMGDSMDLLPELSDETWVASALLEELNVDLPTAGSDIDLVAASREDNTRYGPGCNLEMLRRGRLVPAFLQNSAAGDYKSEI